MSTATLPTRSGAGPTHLLTKEEMGERFEHSRSTYSVNTTDFIKEFVAGNIPREALKRWSLEWTHVTLRTAPPCPGVPLGYKPEGDDVVDKSMSNSMGEVGYMGDPPHPFLARDLSKAFGYTDQEIDDYIPTPMALMYIERIALQLRNAVDERTRASVAVTIEGDASHTASVITDALLDKYGFDEDAASYWIAHATADEAHASEGLDMIYQMCATREEQETALAVGERYIKLRSQVWGSWRQLW